ncbi:hypothetical protein VCHENC02_1083, partial [Vibrio harveyi]
AYIRDYEYENLSSLINAKKKLTGSVSELLEVLEEYRENCTMADQDKFIRLQSVTYELSEVVTTVSASDKNNSA